MNTTKQIFQRTELLLGSELMQKIGGTRVIIFGVGGVGSWCAESLIRSGITRLTIVDSDRICPTNINRQLIATVKTVGQVKVEALKSRLLDINPEAEITAIQQIYCADTADSFHFGTYDYVIDAIDSLTNKALLIRETCKTDAVLFSSMGAALKIDPMQIQVAEFWKVQGCPLAAALRRKFKKSEIPVKKFRCVFSKELAQNKGMDLSSDTDNDTYQTEIQDNSDLATHDWNATKAQINGTLAHTTAIFGFTLAGLVIQSVISSEF